MRFRNLDRSPALELAHRVVWRRDNVPHSYLSRLYSRVSDDILIPTTPISPSRFTMAEEGTVPKPTMNLANNVDVVVPRDEIIHPVHALLRVDALSRELSPMAGPFEQQIQRMSGGL